MLLIREFGVDAVMGRALTTFELELLDLCKEIEAAYLSSERSPDKNAWKKAYPQLYKRLTWARSQAKAKGWIK